jgi:hypothetical protein
MNICQHLKIYFSQAMKGKQAPPGPKAKSIKLYSGPGPMYLRDKLPRTLTKERTKSKIRAKRLKA